MKVQLPVDFFGKLLNAIYSLPIFNINEKNHRALKAMLFFFIPLSLNAQITAPPDPCDDGTQETCQCNTAPILCTIDDLDGFNYSMSSYQHPQDGPNPLCGGNGIPNNPTWFGFIAWCEDLVLEAELSNCEVGCTPGFFCSGPPTCVGIFCPTSIGIQIMVFADCDFTEVVCNVNDCGNEDPKLLEMTGLVIGQTYYFMVDGCAGSYCDVTINVIGTCGNAEIEDWSDPVDGPEEVCLGTSEIFSVENLYGASQYHWYIDGVEVDVTNDPFYEISWFEEGTFDLCVDASNPPCIELPDGPGQICMTVEVFIPIVELGDVSICEENLPFIIDNNIFFEPGLQQYTVPGPNGCDTLKEFTLEVIFYDPPPFDSIICNEGFPFFYPPLGQNIFNIGSYLVDAVDNQGCDSSYQVNFYTMLFEISLFIEGDVLLCPDDGILIQDQGSGIIISDPDLTPVSNIEYEWLLNGETIVGAVDNFYTAIEPGEYAFIIKGEFSGVQCSDTTFFEIDEDFNLPVTPIPEFPESLCPQTSGLITLENFGAGLGVNWLVSGEGEMVSESTDSIEVFALSEGVIEICAAYFFTDCPALTIDTCITIQVLGDFVPIIHGISEFCPDESTTLLTDSSYQAVSWNDGASEDFSFEVSEEGMVTLFAVDSLGCQGMDSIEISEAFPPMPTIAGRPQFCQDGFTELWVDPVFPMIEWSTSETTSGIEVSEVGTVYVFVADSIGCTGRDSIEITLAEELDVEIVGDFEICAGDTTVVTTDPLFAKYEWSNAQTDSLIALTEAGIYSVIVSDGRGCFGFDTIELHLNELPEGVVAPSRPGLCPETAIQLQFETEDEIINYFWSNGDSSNSEITVTERGTYEVTVVDENGCQNSFSIDIPEFEEPDFTISGETSFCSGDSVILNLSERFPEVIWSTGDQTEYITVAEGGRYFVEIMDINGCLGIDSLEVIEIPLPEPVIVGDDEICTGEETILTTTEEYPAYQWSTGETIGEITVNSQEVYFVTVTSEDGCPGSALFELVVHPLPEIEFSGSTTFCTGFSTEISIQDFEEILWSTGDIEQAITITEEGLYSVEVTDSNGCSSIDSIFISEDEELAPVISGQLGFCPGENTTLDVGDHFEQYLWNTGSTLPSIVVDEPGLYSVQVFDSDGCSGTAEVEVVEYESPVIDIVGEELLCFGESTTLQASHTDFEIFEWSTGETGEFIEIQQAGIYTLTVTDDNGCKDEDHIQISIKDEIIPVVIGSFEICDGEIAAFFTEINYDQYFWSNGEITPEIQLSDAGVYSVEVTDEDGCSGRSDFELIVNPLPEVNVGQDRELNCLSLSVYIGADSPTNPDYVYQWIFLDEGVVIGEEPYVEVSQEGVYQLIVTNTVTECTNSKVVNVIQDPADISGWEIDSEDPECHNDNNGFIDVVFIEGGTPPFTFIINGDSSGTGSFTSLGAGLFEISLLDDNGCQLDTAIILINPPLVSVDLGPDISVNFGEELTLEAIVSIGEEKVHEIIWTANGVLLCDPCLDLIKELKDISSTSIELTVIDIRGCSDSDRIFIEVVLNKDVYIPNAFSPNQDGINDVFFVYGADELVEVEEFRVFSRWGNKLYERANFPPNEDRYGWDGTFNGDRMDPGVYSYYVRVRFVDGSEKVFAGDVVLLE